MKVENWDLALVEFASKERGRLYVWGETDCVSLVRRALAVVLGSDPWHGVVPRYRSLKGAVRAGRDLDPRVTLRDTGAVEVGYAYGSGGDVVLGPPREGHSFPQLGIIVPRRYVLTSDPETGVVLRDKLGLPRSRRIFRYG